MITPLFIFTVFMLTLGPIKTVPAFFAMTQNQAPAPCAALALQGNDGGDGRFHCDCLGDDRVSPHRGGSRPTICGSPEAFSCSPLRAK